MAAKRIEALGDAFPYATDGLALYDILQTYVGAHPWPGAAE
jgi:hypothetical protein